VSKKFKIVIAVSVAFSLAYISFRLIKKVNPNPHFEVGQVLDSLNGVKVYYNGGVGHTGARNVAADGYNIGLTFQCVEFVKRYYYEFYHHKMPDSYGNAKDFFDRSVEDGTISETRGLVQFTNPGKAKPCIGDLLVFDATVGNPYGHVAIVSRVNHSSIELIQQNPGPFASSRIILGLDSTSTGFKIQESRLLGWLRMKDEQNDDNKNAQNL
jgi:surface antigen